MRTLLLTSFLSFSLLFIGCDECRKVECENGGTCVEGTCDCPDGFSGVNCELEDLCITQAVTCENDQNCVSGVCDCKQPYYGDNCEVYCLYGTYENGTCTCNQGIEGENCDIFSRDKFIGTYVFTNKDGNSQSCSISKGDFENGDVWKVEMTNLSSFSDTDGYAEISGDEISFPDQTVKGQGSVNYDITTTTPGVFSDDGDEITFTIKVTRLSSIMGSTTETDTYVYSRSSL